jgi:hypothetical protein
VNLADAEALFVELAGSTNEVHVEVGTTGRPRHEYAYLKLTSPSDPDSYAIVSTPGINWYELEVAGDFHTGNADDLALDEDVREYVERYLRAALAYLDGRWSTSRSRFLHIQRMTVQTEDGPLNLAPRGHASTNRA